MRLRFHKKIYREASVQAAAEAFKGIARVTIEDDGDYIVALLQPEGDESEEELAGEFGNFVLGETISAVRGQS